MAHINLTLAAYHSITFYVRLLVVMGSIKIAISVEHDNTATLYSEEGARSADWRLDTLYRVHYNTGLA